MLGSCSGVPPLTYSSGGRTLPGCEPAGREDWGSLGCSCIFTEKRSHTISQETDQRTGQNVERSIPRHPSGQQDAGNHMSTRRRLLYWVCATSGCCLDMTDSSRSLV